MKSKYKNPDKFIAKLKRECVRLKNCCKAIQLDRDVVRGDRVVWYNKGHIQNQNVDVLKMEVFEPGDTILIIGKVKKVSMEKEIESTSSDVDYELLEVRRRKP